MKIPESLYKFFIITTIVLMSAVAVALLGFVVWFCCEGADQIKASLILKAAMFIGGLCK